MRGSCAVLDVAPEILPDSYLKTEIQQIRQQVERFEEHETLSEGLGRLRTFTSSLLRSLTLRPFPR